MPYQNMNRFTPSMQISISQPQRDAGLALEHHRNDGDADMQPLAIANAADRNENQIISSVAIGSGHDEALLST